MSDKSASSGDTPRKMSPPSLSKPTTLEQFKADLRGMTPSELLSLRAGLQDSLKPLKQKLAVGDLMVFMREILKLSTPSHVQTWKRLIEGMKPDEPLIVE